MAPRKKRSKPMAALCAIPPPAPLPLQKSSPRTPPSTIFELEDIQEWWSSSPPEAVVPDSFADSMINPLLHFPDEVPETQVTLQGICTDPPVAPPVGKRKRTGTPLTLSPRSKAISPRESHILSERQRRKGMNHLFSTLASLLPESSSKSDKSTIVTEIISYIQALQKELEELSKRRAEAVAQNRIIHITDSDCTDEKQLALTPRKHVMYNEDDKLHLKNVILSVCGSDVFVTICSSKECRNLFSKALTVIEQHKLRILDANISNSDSMSFHYFHLKALDERMLLPRDILQKELQDLTVSSPSV